MRSAWLLAEVPRCPVVVLTPQREVLAAAVRRTVFCLGSDIHRRMKKVTPLLRERVVGLLLPLMLFIAALVGSVGVILPAAVLLLATRGHLLPVYRWIVDSCSFAWFTLSSALLEWLARVRVVVRGDGATRPTDERVSIVICNHNSRLDWMFLWCLMARHRSCGRLKIALQEPLKAAGPFGWAMQAFLFIFLSRKDREVSLTRTQTRTRTRIRTLTPTLTLTPG